MIAPRVPMPVVTVVTAMAGLVGSVAPAPATHPPSIVDTPAETTWLGAPLAAAGQPLEDQIRLQIERLQAERKRREDALTASLTQLDQGSVDLAVAVLDRRTGRTYSYAGTKQFRTASIVKVDILATLLLQANRTGRPLSAAEKELAAAMIGRSDNDAASALWRRTGGIAGSMSTFGLTSTRQGADGDWGETVTTAEDQLRLLATLADPAGALPNSEYVLDLMSAVASDQDWGISAAAREGEQTALKNGWFPLGSGWILNSIGRITDADTDLLMVVLSRGHSSYQAGIRTVEQVATQVRDTVENRPYSST